MSELIQHVPTLPRIFRFLGLPVEIRCEVVDHLSGPSDIKALCLVSKEICNIATPRLYNRVDLYPKSDPNDLEEEEAKMLARVISLLSATSNLRFIRILNTGRFGESTTEAIDALLPQLQENALTDFNFSDDKTNMFPTRRQLRLLWSRQKNLQNMQLTTDHFPYPIDPFNETQEFPIYLPKSVTRLGLTNNYWQFSPYGDAMLDPLMFTDMFRLRCLTLNGPLTSKVVHRLNLLFASRSLFNLTELHLEQAIFQETLELSNLASLDLLSFGGGRRSQNYNVKSKELVVPADLPLRKLVWIGGNPVYPTTLETVLTRVISLEHLEIESFVGFDRTTRARKALAEAIQMHKATLKTLIIDELMLTEASAYDRQFLRRIWMCKQLEVLSLPLPPNKPVAYYMKIIASLPCLKEFKIYDHEGANSDINGPRIVELIKEVSNFPRMEFFGFTHSSFPNLRRLSHSSN